MARGIRRESSQRKFKLSNYRRLVFDKDMRLHLMFRCVNVYAKGICPLTLSVQILNIS